MTPAPMPILANSFCGRPPGAIDLLSRFGVELAALARLALYFLLSAGRAGYLEREV